MLTKARIKLIRSLRLKKYRQQNNLFVAEGTKIVTEIVQSDWLVVQVLATEDWLTEHKTIANKVDSLIVSEKQMQQLTMLSSPSPVLALVEIPNPAPLPDLHQQWTLYLDDLRDPGNLGTIIRLADWFGWPTICLSPETVDPFNPKVIQATMGSLTRVGLHTVEPGTFWTKAQGLPIWGAHMEGASIYEAEVPQAGILCIGSESHGLSETVQQQLTHTISIPRQGQAESLNAAMATGILLSHMTWKKLT